VVGAWGMVYHKLHANDDIGDTGVPVACICLLKICGWSAPRAPFVLG
jgi:hypothetical protein